MCVNYVIAITSMGYTSTLSGAAQGALSAALAYDLMEKRGAGFVGVTRAGMLILVGEGDGHANALWQAARTPAVHQQLNKTYIGGTVPSQKAVEAHLQLQNFSPAAAATAAKGYIEAIRLADEKGEKTVTESASTSVDGGHSVAEQQRNGGPTMTTAAGFETRLSGPLPGGNEFLLNTREPITEAGLRAIREALRIIEIALEPTTDAEDIKDTALET